MCNKRINAVKIALFALTIAIVGSGCLTSEQPFYQDSDIKTDDGLIGTYEDKVANPQSPIRFQISKVSDFSEQKGHYYVIISESPGCSMKFGAVLFQIGTNRFLDMVPMIEACDHVAANPPSLIELLQSATLKPLHMVIRVDISTNLVNFAFVDHPKLTKAAIGYPEFFQTHKPGELPRLVSDTARERQFLLRFGGDTNIFKTSQLKRESH